MNFWLTHRVEFHLPVFCCWLVTALLGGVAVDAAVVVAPVAAAAAVASIPLWTAAEVTFHQGIFAVVVVSVSWSLKLAATSWTSSSSPLSSSVTKVLDQQQAREASKTRESLILV